MAIDVAEVKKRLMALLNDMNLVNEYVRQYGPALDIKNIKKIKEEKGTALSLEDDGPGQDPIFEITLTCPVCNRENVTGYELRAKSQQVTQNKFLVPIYKGALGHKTVDYTRLAVSVCPRCLFSSPDKKDFIRTSPGVQEEAKSQLTSNIVMSLQEKIGERRAILKSVIDYEGYFRRPRSLDASIDSYRLSMSRAKVEMWYEQPYSIYKAGAYALRISKLMKDAGIDNREMLREALGFYEEAFRASNCPSEEIEMQVIYVIVALYLKLEAQRKAHSYIGVFANLINSRKAEMRENPKLNTMTIERWADKATRLWEDRDDLENLFKEE